MSRSMRRSRKIRKQSDDGCLLAFFPIIIVLGVIVGVAQFVAENIGVIFIVLLVVGAIVGLIVAINNFFQKRQEADAERQRNIEIANLLEMEPSLITIPTTTDFSNREEEWVNQNFRNYLKYQNDVILATSHLEYLENKARALRFLERNEDASQIDALISQVRSKMLKIQSDESVLFESKYVYAFYRSTEIKNAYTEFSTKLPNERVDWLENFFRNSHVKIVKIDSSTALVFCPEYVIRYTGVLQKLEIFTYADMTVSSRITTELLDAPIEATDEIEHIGYRYETKDGRRDMRYSYENNPSFTYVYRGKVTLKVADTIYEQKFPNKSQTEVFEQNIKDYVMLMSGKYKTAVNQALIHNEEIISLGNIDMFIAQQDTTDKLK